jgi:hypothetical protein
MSFGLYSIGFAILIGGLIYAAYLMHMPTHWIVVGAIITLRRWDSVGCQDYTSERSCGITLLSPQVRRRGMAELPFLGNSVLATRATSLRSQENAVPHVFD